MIYDENEMGRIIEEISSAEVDKNKDKFTKKFAFVA